MNEAAHREVATRQEFSVPAEVKGFESSPMGIALAARAKAIVEARYIAAWQRPRDWDQVRQNILKECKRPEFAKNKSTLYLKPIGRGVEGLGIRFVEVAIRCIRNLACEYEMIFQDQTQEVWMVTITDFESNVPHSGQLVVPRTVERAKPMDDGTYLSMRKNSEGRNTYTVSATEDDMLNKRAAFISKAIRTVGLRLVPGDIQDEATRLIKEIREDEAAKDPNATRKAIVDAFGEIGVTATMLVEYLEHPLDQCNPEEMVRLRGIFGAINEGEATWVQVMENRDAERQGKEAPGWKPEEFNDALAKWAPLILDRRRSHDQVVNMANQRTRLSDEQVKIIRALPQNPKPDAPAIAPPAEPAGSK
jgi:hypothetical protein